MKENRLDSITDGIKERVSSISAEVHKQFKGTNPYRQEPKTTRESLLEYNELTPEREQALRQSVGDEIVDEYVAKMEKAKRRYQ